MHPQLQRTWEPDDVEEELRSALAVVDKLNPPEDLRGPVFQFAASLLSQRAQTQALPVDVSGLMLGAALGRGQ